MPRFVSRSRSTLPALAGLALLAACGGSSSSQHGDADSGRATADAPLTLTSQDVIAAATVSISEAVTVSGPLEPRDVVIVRSQLPGTIGELRVDRGTPVRAGQRLATIRAVGVLSQSASAKAGVAAADANVAVARKQLEAARILNAAGAMSDIERQSAEAAFESAQAQLAAARAQSAAASEAAGYSVVLAPIDGVVSARRVDDGESIKSGDEMLTIVDSRTLELAGQIGVADAARVRVGQEVAFALDAFPSESFTGRIMRIAPVADAGTRQVGVFVELRNTTRRIVGGQFARGRIALGRTSAISVPQSAVQSASADSAWVFVVSNGRLAKRVVSLGARDDAAGIVAVTRGLASGELVLRTVTTDIVDGTRVQVLGADAPAMQATPSAASTGKE